MCHINGKEQRFKLIVHRTVKEQQFKLIVHRTAKEQQFKLIVHRMATPTADTEENAVSLTGAVGRGRTVPA